MDIDCSLEEYLEFVDKLQFQYLGVCLMAISILKEDKKVK